MPKAAAATQPSVLTRESRTHVVAQLLSLSPLAVLGAAAAFPQTLLLPSTDPAPQLLGIPAQAVIGLVTVLWTLTGAVIVRNARSPLTQSLALLVFTIPATIAAVIAPALLLVLLSRP